jgi:hypothetical protein
VMRNLHHVAPPSNFPSQRQLGIVFSALLAPEGRDRRVKACLRKEVGELARPTTISMV